MSENRYNLLDALAAIPPDVHYEDHLAVGQALHYEGYDVSVWRDWVSRCTQPDHAKRLKEVDRKWRSFGSNTGSPITGGTLVKIARDNGWEPNGGTERKSTALAWDSVIGGKAAKEAVEADEPAIVDAASVSEYDAEVSPLFPEGSEVNEFCSFLSALFEPNEKIGYVCDYQEEPLDDGGVKFKPGSRGVFSRTMQEVCDSVKKNGMEGGLSSTLHDESGAWIRFNPLDGEGVGNANVTAFRFALLESDEMPNGKFAAIVKQLNLPIAAMVDSGNKSLHAIVRIDASDAKQYRERVEALYSRCEKNGIKVDKANKNPSRMCRMPGVTRNGRRQFLAGLSQGAADWEEWEEWYAEETDELPDVESLADAFDNPEELNPELISGILRVGHKMLLSGPSKAGKSFALLSLAVAFAEGAEWMGFKCRKSNVLYVNLEVDRKSFKARFVDVYNALERQGKLKRTNAEAVKAWNLRGKTEPMSKLLPKLVRRAIKNEADVVIIDPIYKVQTGDENSAGDMAAFSNLFDALCAQAGVSVIYCHHHSKGFQGGKRSVDRSSGSGVFGRDPDAILDMIELEVTDDDKWEFASSAFISEVESAVVYAGGAELWEMMPLDIRKVPRYALDNAEALVDKEEYERLSSRLADIQENYQSYTAWRITSTLREFRSIKPVNAWFAWPLFSVDDALSDKPELGAEEQPNRGRGKGRGKGKGSGESEGKQDAEKQYLGATYDEINDAIDEAVAFCIEEGESVNRPNVKKYIRELKDKNGNLRKPTVGDIANWTTAAKPWCRWIAGKRDETNKRGAVLLVRRDGE